MEPFTTQLASIELVGLALFGVIGLGYAVAEIVQGRTPIGRSHLRTRLERIGVRAKKGRLQGVLDGVEVDVEEIPSSRQPYLVTARCAGSIEGLTISSVEDGLRAERIQVGDPEFDGVVQVVGPRLEVLSMLGEAERALLLEAVSKGWSYGQGRFSRLVQWPKEVVPRVEDGARFAKALSSTVQRPGLPIERVAELYQSDKLAGMRAQRLSILIEHGGNVGLELARAALEEAQDEVRLVAAERLRHYPTLVDLFVKTASDGLRRQAFAALLRAEDPNGLRLALLVLEDAVQLSGAQSAGVGELVATHQFPGRLELARSWVRSRSAGLRPYAWRVLGAEGDRSDLDLLVEPAGDADLERARGLIRNRLMEQGQGTGQLALSSDGGELCVVSEWDIVADDSSD